MDAGYLDIIYEIDHDDGAYYDSYYRDHYAFIQQEEQRLKLQRQELQTEKESLQREREEFEKEKLAQQSKWDQINKELDAKIKAQQETDPTQTADADLKKDIVQKEVSVSTKKLYFSADHEKCHKVNHKLKAKLKEKSQQMEELQAQIKKLRGEVRQNHAFYEKFLEYERLVIKQKFDLKELETENDELNDMYQELLEQHQELLDNKEKEANATNTAAARPYFPYDHDRSGAQLDDDKDYYFDPSRDSTSNGLASTSQPDPTTKFIRTPLRNRPAPTITRNTPQRRNSTSSSSSTTMEASYGTADIDIDDRFDVIHEQIQELREHIKNSSGSRTGSPAPSATSYGDLQETDDDIPLPHRVTVRGETERTDRGSADRVDVYDTPQTKQGEDSPKAAKKTKRCCRRGLWRFFGICSSAQNRNVQD